MMYTIKQRISATLVATALTAAAGAGGGYLLSREESLDLAGSRLELHATNVLNMGAVSLNESFAVVAAMKRSPYPLCSDAEIGYFRSLVFPSQYLKDIGRMHDGRILCSANLGRLKQPSTQYKPDFIQPNGTQMYKNMGPYRMDNLTIASFQLGDFYAVLSPETERSMKTGPMHFTITSLAQSKQPQVIGEFPGAPADILTKEGQGRFGDSLYATRCNIRFSTCSTAYISVQEVLSTSRSWFQHASAAGGMLGAFLGLFCSIVYRRSRGMEQQLRRAIRRDKLRVVYQPIVELAGRRIVGAEALARWTDEDGFAVGPDLFVKLAEERGIVGDITRTVLRHVLRDFGEILRTYPDFRLSINVTAADLADPGFLPMLDHSLRRSGIAARSLVVEITESSTARHKMAIEATRQLQERGHSVAIDDFGTGYSSLAYLHELSVDAIKIDKAFTSAIGTEAVTVAILPQIRALAESLNLQVVVEGIETEEQASYFADAKRPILAQGWLFGHPVPADEFHRILAEEEQKHLVSLATE